MCCVLGVVCVSSLILGFRTFSMTYFTIKIHLDWLCSLICIEIKPYFLNTKVIIREYYQFLIIDYNFAHRRLYSHLSILSMTITRSQLSQWNTGLLMQDTPPYKNMFHTSNRETMVPGLNLNKRFIEWQAM